MLQSVPTSQLQHPVIRAGFVETASDNPLIQFAGSIGGSHALVIAPNGLDLMCSLLRQGCSAATMLRLADRPELKAYDLVLAPHVTSAVQIGRLVYQAKRAILPTGRFLAYVPNEADDPEDDVGGLLARTLRLAGFASVWSKIVLDGLAVRADVGLQEWPSALQSLVIRRQA